VDQQHSITLKSIDISTSSVVITVTSIPTDYTLYLKSPAKVLGRSKVLGEIAELASEADGAISDIDANHDGQADIRVTLKVLTGSYAKINFISLTAAGSTHLLGMLGVGG